MALRPGKFSGLAFDQAGVCEIIELLELSVQPRSFSKLFRPGGRA